MAIVLWILWILLALLLLIVLLLVLPVGVKIEYLEQWKIRILLFGFIPIFTLSGDKEPTKKKEKLPAEPSLVKEAKQKHEDKPSFKDEFSAFRKKEGLKGVMELFRSLLRIVQETLRGVAHGITVSDLQLCVRVGGEEADKTAIRYGEICSVLYPLLTSLASCVTFRRQIVRIQPDFLAEGIDVRMRMKLRICPIRLLWTALVALVKTIGLWSKVTDSNVPAEMKNETKSAS